MALTGDGAMLDGFTDFALDHCSHDCGRPTWPRIAVKLGLFYLVLAALCWTESQFRNHGIDVEAKVELIGRGPKDSQLVRYWFRDPVTNLPRMNTVTLGRCEKLPGPVAVIEYIPGDYPTSRLKVQARPYSISLFTWLNVIFVAGAIGFVCYLAREANRPIRRQRFGQ